MLQRIIKKPKIRFENDAMAAIFSHPCLLSGQLIHMLVLGLDQNNLTAMFNRSSGLKQIFFSTHSPLNTRFPME